ncbi:MAG: hypothetical protein IJ689_03415 [Alphaproteobacteria bacterium]|nr:hypothetical protein [Alphaproteobacteria bacterium]
MSRIKAFAVLSLILVTASSCSFWNRSLQEVINDPLDKEHALVEDTTKRRVHMAPLQMPRNIVVCRAKQCAPLKLSMSKEYIYNSLVQLLQNNNNQRALVCAADTGGHSCYAHYISLPITVGITPAYMYVDSLKISDVHLTKSERSIKLMLNYNVTYNGQTPECAPDKTLLFVKNTDNIVMEDEGYQCKMTTIGTTTVKTLFLIDYIDLDYGFIGGYYSIGLSGPAYGGGSGYMLIRLPNISYPLKANLPAPEEVKPTEGQAKAAAYMAPPAASTAPKTKDGVQVFPINRK